MALPPNGLSHGSHGRQSLEDTLQELSLDPGPETVGFAMTASPARHSTTQRDDSTVPSLLEPTTSHVTAAVPSQTHDPTPLPNPQKVADYMKKEGRWAASAAKSDPLLDLPPPGHKYVDDEGQSLIRKDNRFANPRKRSTISKQKEIRLPAAGIPSDKPWRPKHPIPSSARRLPIALTDPTLQEESFQARPSINLITPDVIKGLLVDDWENVTKNFQLVPLPHPKPVSKILEDYVAHEASNRVPNSSHMDILEESMKGLKEYFNACLGRILLYRYERPQYTEVYKKICQGDEEFKDKKTASDVYGAEHLSRLWVSLPELIAQTNMDQQSLNRLREELTMFVTWLSKNSKDYFVPNYETPSSDYVDKTKNN